MYSESDAWGKYQQDSLTGQSNKKDLTSNIRESQNFGERVRAAFSQHETLPKELT